MRLNKWIIFCLLSCAIFPLNGSDFIANREELKPLTRNQNVVIIASTGRSGSTMLTKAIKKHASNYKVLKTHLLPPDWKFKGKILFIFSNPDQASESALHMTLSYTAFAQNHFDHVETADRLWAALLGGAQNQTEHDNLLSYDALGIYKHLRVWLYTGTKPATPEEAQILAVKYENLWEEGTVQAIRLFLNIPQFELPAYRPRGKKEEQLLPKEKTFRELYNLGTVTEPRYAAYDKARLLWEQAPPYQFLKISPN